MEQIEKEIYEQPDNIRKASNTIVPDLSKYKKIVIVASNSSYNAGFVGKNLIEKYGNIPTYVEFTSEFNNKFLNKDTLVMTISESSDKNTLEVAKKAKETGCDTLGIFNNIEDIVTNDYDNILYTQANNSSILKGYTSQLDILGIMACNFARNNDLNKLKEISRFLIDIKRLPFVMKQVLDENEKFKQIANDIYDKKNIFITGKGIDYSTAMEGKLRFKELNLPCDAYPSSELKTMINIGTPVIGLNTDEVNSDKTKYDLNKLKDAGANIIYITSRDLNSEDVIYNKKIVLPETSPILQPIINIISLQLISYFASTLNDKHTLKKEF